MLNLHKKLLGEVPTTYNGGGKSGGGQTFTPPPLSTETVIGDKLSAQGSTFNQDEEDSRRAAVNKVSKGTRGLQIPLVGEGAKALSESAATTGVQL